VRNTHKSMRSPSTSNFVGLPLSRKSMSSFIGISSSIDELVKSNYYQRTESKVKEKTGTLVMRHSSGEITGRGGFSLPSSVKDFSILRFICHRT
jgi:hypothetical protein